MINVISDFSVELLSPLLESFRVLASHQDIGPSKQPTVVLKDSIRYRVGAMVHRLF